jgi:hypothetical protein
MTPATKLTAVRCYLRQQNSRVNPRFFVFTQLVPVLYPFQNFVLIKRNKK